MSLSVYSYTIMIVNNVFIFTLIKYCIFNDINDLLLTKNDTSNLFLNFHFDFGLLLALN